MQKNHQCKQKQEELLLWVNTTILKDKNGHKDRKPIDQGRTQIPSTWLICWDNKYIISYRLQVQVRLVLLLVGAEPINRVDVFRVRLIKVGERHDDGGTLKDKHMDQWMFASWNDLNNKGWERMKAETWDKIKRYMVLWRAEL